MLGYAAVGEWCIEATYSGMGEEKCWLLYISIRSYHLHPFLEGLPDPCFLRFRLLKIKKNKKWAMSSVCYSTWDSTNCFSNNHMEPKAKLHVPFVILFPCAYKQMLNMSSSGSWDQNPVAVTVRRDNLVLFCLLVARSFGESLLKILMVNLILSFICPHISNFIMASEAPLQLGCPTLI